MERRVWRVWAVDDSGEGGEVLFVVRPLLVVVVADPLLVVVAAREPILLSVMKLSWTRHLPT